MQKVLYTRDIQSVSEFVDSAVISYINEGQIETFESFSTFDIIAFDWYDVRHLDRAPGQIMIYLDADDLFFLCENEYAYNKAAALFKPADSNERALYSFFRALLRDDGQLLEESRENPEPEGFCRSLIQLALDLNSPDNVTALAVQV